MSAAIVTGGAGMIGASACEGLAAKGHEVLVVDLDEAAAQETVDRIAAAGGTASAFGADVSDDASVAAYVAACVERHGAPRAFFNNAAMPGAIAPIEDYPVDVFDRVLAVNVRGVFLGLRHVLPVMREAGGGSILNTASQAGIRGVTGLSGYSASKHAVVGLSRGAALESAPLVRVNCLAPGPTDTAMMTGIAQTITDQGGDASGFVERIPVGRYGRPEEIGAAAVWLLTEAPEFLTGAVVPVDGGMTTP